MVVKVCGSLTIIIVRPGGEGAHLTQGIGDTAVSPRKSLWLEPTYEVTTGEREPTF